MMFDDKEFIAKKIRLARKNAKLTQEELSEIIGISAKQLSRIEMAAYIPSLPTFFKLVNALKIDLKEFGLEEQVSKSQSQEKFLKLVYSLSENEQEYYYNVLKTMIDNASLLKK